LCGHCPPGRPVDTRFFHVEKVSADFAPFEARLAVSTPEPMVTHPLLLVKLHHGKAMREIYGKKQVIVGAWTRLSHPSTASQGSSWKNLKSSYFKV
jgi:hypothetical protein